MLKVKEVFCADYHEFDVILHNVNMFLTKGEKKYRFEEIGFNPHTHFYCAVFFNGPYPKQKIKQMKEEYKQMEETW